MRLYLVRHGESTYNAEGRIQGQSDAPLSERGRWQAEEIGRRLALVSFEACYASDLSRAADTARAIMAHHPGVPFTFDPILREIAFGVFEDLTPAEIETRYPDEYRLWSSVGHDAVPGSLIRTYTPEGAESTDELHERAGRAVMQLRGYAHRGAVLVVAHGGLLRSLVAHALHLDEQARYRFHFDNTGLTIIEDDVYTTLRLFNDTSHLGEESPTPWTEEVAR